VARDSPSSKKWYGMTWYTARSLKRFSSFNALSINQIQRLFRSTDPLLGLICHLSRPHHISVAIEVKVPLKFFWSHIINELRQRQRRQWKRHRRHRACKSNPIHNI